MTGGQPDPAALLARVADALNACERAGVTVQLNHGGALTSHGYVLATGDPRLGTRWQARMRLRRGQTQPEGRDEGDPGPWPDATLAP